MQFTADRCADHKPNRMLRLAMQGDREAMGSVFKGCMPRLYRAALRVVGTPEDAEDALQDGLLQAARHLPEFEGRTQFSTWLTQIVVNAALDHCSVNDWSIGASSILYFHRNTTGSALTCSKY